MLRISKWLPSTLPLGVNASTILRAAEHCINVRRESRITALRRESSVYIRRFRRTSSALNHWDALTPCNRLLCRIMPQTLISPSSLLGKKGLSSIAACVYSCKAWRWFVWKVGRNERLERDRSSHLSLQSIIHTRDGRENHSSISLLFLPPP